MTGLPVVVIAGRPNVGKSTLFNKLAGRRSAIVSDTPGVTRDRKEAEAVLRGRRVRLVDTAPATSLLHRPGKHLSRHWLTILRVLMLPHRTLARKRMIQTSGLPLRPVCARRTRRSPARPS